MLELQMPQSQNYFYRPELDVVRFVAFLCVFFHHTIPRSTGLHGPAFDSIVDSLGFGLSLFFTLSAYLITLILLRENEQTGTIHLRAFYLRRILRIWPLYLVGLSINIVVSLLVGHWNASATAHDLLLGLLICGNLVPLNDIAHMTIGALWSISLEEQFYIFWPPAMRLLSSRLLLSVAICILIVSNVSLIYLGIIRAEPDVRVWTNSFVQFQCFAAGIILALCDKWRRVFSPIVSSALVVIAALLMFIAVFSFGIKGHPVAASGPTSYVIGYFLVSAGCALILVSAPGFSRCPKLFVYLGKISFGLYVFHGPVIILAGKYLDRHVRHGHLVISLLATILLAALSYRYFETPFLRLKRSNEIVVSRPI